MRNVIAFLVALGIAAAIFWWTRDDDRARSPDTTTGSGATTTTSTAPASTGSSAAPQQHDEPIDTSKVRRLDPAARKRLGEQIAAARERARATATAAGEPFTEDVKLEDVAAPLQSKLEESLPLLAECYAKRTGPFRTMAKMTLTSDPELGTVIDTDAIKDAAGQPLEPELDTCLRDAIDLLALPPIGPRGGKLQLQYTFKFE